MTGNRDYPQLTDAGFACLHAMPSDKGGDAGAVRRALRPAEPDGANVIFSGFIWFVGVFFFVGGVRPAPDNGWGGVGGGVWGGVGRGGGGGGGGGVASLFSPPPGGGGRE